MSKNFLKNFSIYGIGGMISRFAGIITAPIYTRILGAEGYGLLDLLLSISAILIILATMEMHSGYSRSYFKAKGKGELETLRGSVMLFFIGSYLILLIFFFLFFQLIEQWINLFDISLLVPVVLGILPVMIITLTLITIQFEQKPLLYSMISILNLFFTAGGGVFSVFYLDLGVSGILWSNAIVGFIVVFILSVTLPIYTNFKFNIRYIKEVASYSIPIVPAVLGAWLNNYIGRIYISGALTLSMLGVYSISFKLALIMMLAIGAFNQTWSPRANKLFNQKGSEPQFAKVLNYYLFIFSFLVFLIVSASPLIVRILAPEEFYPAIGITSIIVVGSFWDGAKHILAAGNNWDRKTYFNSIASIAGGVANFLLLYFFIKTGGIIIAAVGFTLGMIIQVGLLLYTSQKNHYIPYSYINLIITLILLTGYSLVSYYLYNAHGVSGFLLFQLPIGILIIRTMYFTFFNPKDRSAFFKKNRSEWP